MAGLRSLHIVLRPATDKEMLLAIIAMDDVAAPRRV